MDFEFEPEEKKTPSGRGGPRHPHKIRRSDDIPDNEPVPVDSADFFQPAHQRSRLRRGCFGRGRLNRPAPTRSRAPWHGFFFVRFAGFAMPNLLHIIELTDLSRWHKL